MLLATMIAGSYALAQSSSGDFEIHSHTVDGGGGQSSGGDFVVIGTIGQHDASSSPATGGAFSVSGGFWANVSMLTLDLIFSDGFESE